MKLVVILLASLALVQTATAQANLEQKKETKLENPSHDVHTSKETSEETLLESEVSRTERAERMKKILGEVRKDLQNKKEQKKKSQAPAAPKTPSTDDTSTN